jgi:acyl carrier protein
LVREVTAMLVEGLDLPDDPERIDPDQPLFGRGLELDSLDTLEIVSLIEEEYDVMLEDTPSNFGSINKVVDQLGREEEG